MRIEESSGKKPRKAAKKVASGGAPAKGRGLLAAAIVVLGAGLAVWWMMKGEGTVGIRRGQTPSRREIMAFLVRTKCSYFRF